MKNKMLTLSTLGALSIVPSFTVVACSSTGNADLNKKTFNVEVDYSNKLNKSTSKVNVYQAEANANALSEVEKIKNNLTKEQLQFDFKTVLQDFYEAYEVETSKYEIEIESINVVGKNDDGSFNLDVKYEIETDNKRDKEEIKTKRISWTPTMKLISKDDIKKIKDFIIKLKDKNNSGFDIKDIKELFLGEKDEDDFDDKGIFDKVALVNKDYNGLAYLLAYEISIDDIFSKLLPSRKESITTKTKFLVPSLYLNSNAMIFVPNSKPDMDYNQKSLSLSELNTIFGDSSQNKVIESKSDQQPFIDTLNKLFTKTYTIDELKGAKEISKITLTNPNSNGTSTTTNEYQVIIEFKNSRKSPDMIVFLANKIN